MAHEFTTTCDSEVAMVTFGNKQVWKANKGEKFYYDILVTRNDSFLVAQCGLNLYVFEARAVPLPLPVAMKAE